MAHGRKGTKPDGVGDGDAARGPLHLGWGTENIGGRVRQRFDWVRQRSGVAGRTAQDPRCRRSLVDLRLFRADLVQYPRCGWYGGLQWFQVNRDDQPCWRLTPQCATCNPRMHRQPSPKLLM